jgi:Calcineurin-like phosphoesterase
MTDGGPDLPPTVDEYAADHRTALSRMTVTRRGLLVAAAGAAATLAAYPLARRLFLAGGGHPGRQGLVLSGRHLSWAQDGAGDPTTAMRVTAQLLAPSGRLPPGLTAIVDVGDAPGAYGTPVPARIVHLAGPRAIPGGPPGSQFYVKAELTGLRPDTVHHYRLRLSDGTTTGDAHFVTAPSRRTLGTPGPQPEPFTFTAFADVGTNVPAPATGFANGYAAGDPVLAADPHPAVTQTARMATQRPRFTLLAGDICYADPSGTGLPADDRAGAPAGTDAFDPYVWDVFLAQIDGQAAYTPWMFTTGNHDMEALYGDGSAHGYAGHAARLDLPRNGPGGCPSVYSVTYANVGVISLDANELSAEIRTNRGYSGGAQVRWLTETLRGWRTDPAVAPGIDFVVAFFHHCAYSTTSQHASDGGVRDAVDGLFSTYQVDLAVQGHNHVMERTDPIRHGRRTRPAPDGATVEPARDGVTYVCIGSGGRARYGFLPAPGPGRPAPPGVTPAGDQARPEGQRYRGYSPARAENTTGTVLNSYVWAAGDGTGVRVPEQVDWSQVRYDGYAILAVDVVPARVGRPTTMTLRTLADAVPGRREPYTEIDRVTLRRTAGKSRLEK